MFRMFGNFFDSVPGPGFGDTSIALSQGSGPAGTEITVSGSGFDGRETVRIRFHTTDLAKVEADDDGSFSDIAVEIPDIGFDGQFDIIASGDRSIRSAREPFNVE